MTTGGTGNVCEPGEVDLLKEKTYFQTQTKNVNQETAESDVFPELDLCPKPVHQRASEGSVESEMDAGNEAIQPEKSVQGAENQKGPPLVRTLRRLPENRRICAVPDLKMRDIR